MKFVLLAFALACLASEPLHGGRIVGVVRAESPPDADEAAGGGDAYQSRRYRFLDRIDYEQLRDFVVYIESPAPETINPDRPRPTATVEQRNGAFIPRVLPITAGTKVVWPNRDDIYHNVFSMSDARPFDLGMYKSSDHPKGLVFDKPGQIDVFCAIHSQMHGIVLVLPTPYFAMSDARGRFAIEDVPAGRHRLKAWHERLPAKTVEIEAPASGAVEVEIVMGFSDLPKI